MWQVVSAKIFIQGRVVIYISSFFYGSSHIVPIPVFDLEVVHCCYVASCVLMFKYW